MGGGRFGWKKIKAYLQLVKLQQQINKDMILKQEAVIESMQFDRIVHNGKVMYPVVWGLSNPNKTTLICPVPYMHYTPEQSHVAFHRDFGPLLNKWSYKLANYGLIKTIASSLKYLSTKEDVSSKTIRTALNENQVFYTVSPTLFARPKHWSKNLHVLGYHERSKTNTWQPNQELLDFLGKHQEAILVTFGSMINTNPPQKTKIILDILEKHQIPAIINTAAGGLVQPETYNKDLFHFVDRIPYDWAFERLYGVIHHGGSGTTHTALKNGCASLIIPHIIDQYVWNKIVAQKGAGPLGVDVSKISEKRLSDKIHDFYHNPKYKSNAQAISASIKAEDFEEEILKLIESVE